MASIKTPARAFPPPVHAPPEGWAGAWCRWCGDKITHGRKDRSRHDGRQDEPDCVLAYRLHTDRSAQVAHVGERDGVKCWDCHGEPCKWRRGSELMPFTFAGRRQFDPQDGRIEYVGRYMLIERVTALELEHEVPLWSVTHLPDEERRPYFGPTNLRLRCVPCHAAKTKAEATNRAKGNRQAQMRLGVEKPPSKLKGGSKLPGKGQGGRLSGRGFSKEHRPLRSRNNLRKG
jgi:hypothetical protein